MTDIAELERRVTALEAEVKHRKTRDDRIVGILTELKEDSALLRRHAIASGQKIEDLDARLSSLESEVKSMRADISALPSILAETMREVLKEGR